jgi:hypothetical protein
MVIADGKGHELLERHAVVGEDVEQFFGYRRQAQPLLDDIHAHKEGGRDILVGHALVAQRLEGPELVERVQGDALHILGQ